MPAPDAPRDLVDDFRRGYSRTWLAAFLAYGALVASVAWFGGYALERTPLDPHFMDALSLVIRANAMAVILVMLTIGLHTALASQRLARPAGRIERALARAERDRDYAHTIALEPHDYLDGVASAVNGLLARLATDQRRLAELARALEGAPDAELRRLARELASLAGTNPPDGDAGGGTA